MRHGVLNNSAQWWDAELITRCRILTRCRFNEMPDARCRIKWRAELIKLIRDLRYSSDRTSYFFLVTRSGSGIDYNTALREGHSLFIFCKHFISSQTRFISLQSMFLHVHCLYRVILFLLVENKRYLLAVTWLNYMQVVLGGGLVTKCSECLYATITSSSEFKNTGSKHGIVFLRGLFSLSPNNSYSFEVSCCL